MMELVKCATFPSCRPGKLVRTKETGCQVQHEQVNGIRRAVVSVSQLGCGGELEFLPRHKCMRE